MEPSFESSILSIAVETVVKLLSLTDAGLFLLIDTSAGRRFVGSAELCDAYLSGVLRPRGDDVQLEVDPGVVVREKIFDGEEEEEELPRDCEMGYESVVASSTASSRSRRKRKLGYDGEGDVVAKKSSASSVKMEPVVEIRGFDDTDFGSVPDDVEDLAAVYGGFDAFTAVAVGTDPSTAAGEVMGTRLDHRESLVEEELLGQLSHEVALASKLPAEIGPVFQEKLRAVLEQDPVLAFTHASGEQKLLLSVLYDYAKHLAHHVTLEFGVTAPYINAFYHRCFDRFAETYFAGFLAKVPRNTKVKFGNKRTGKPSLFIKKTCNDYFRVILRRRVKKETKGGMVGTLEIGLE